MTLFAPDDFAGRPYVAGLNQGGHVALGASIAGVLTTVFPVWAAVTIAGGGILAWEAWQLLRKGATRADYRADLAYWWAGVAGWAWLIDAGHVSGIGVFAPCGYVVAYCAEWTRQKVKQ